MAEFLHVNSPQEPTSLPTHRHSLPKKPKLTRKRRAESILNQRASMARFGEPTFCPSDASDIFVSGAFLHSLPPSARDTHSPFHTRDIGSDERDDDDTEAGVLPKTQLMTNEDPTVTDALDHVHNASTITPNETHTRNVQLDEHLDHGHSSDISSTMTMSQHSRPRRRSHPRPITSDILDEEGGRRTRPALESDPTTDSPRFTRPTAWSTASEARQEASAQLLSRPTATTRHTSPTNRSAISIPQTLLSHQPTQAEIEAARVVLAHEARSDDVDEDALAVDDPRRNYDVADFMDTWRLNSVCNKRLPSFEPAFQSSLDLGRRPEQVTRANVDTGSVDMQGIQWQSVGSSRRQAMIARAVLHPSGFGTTYLPSKQPPNPTVIEGEDERYYQFRAAVFRHTAKFSHYQLRNVLAGNSRNDVFYATGNQVVRASLACPTVRECTMDLSKPGNGAASFRVTCLSTSLRHSFSEYRTDNVLLAGGFYGEYAIRTLNLDQRHSEGFVTHAYNGLVTHIHNHQDRRGGGLRAAFCSNDRKVRLMDVRRLEFISEFSYESAINCSAISPDGRLRVLVGDTTETLITDAERGGSMVTLKEHDDHGFACAWSQSGRLVATGAQDGSVLVWDSRNWSKPLRALNTVMSCARSLNFTDTDALVVAENDDVVRVYDADRFDEWQEIRFFGSIAGVALLDGGAEIAIANADKTVGGLMTFERSNQGAGRRSYRRRITKAGVGGARLRQEGLSRWRQNI